MDTTNRQTRTKTGVYSGMTFERSIGKKRIAGKPKVWLSVRLWPEIFDWVKDQPDISYVINYALEQLIVQRGEEND